MKTYKQLTSGQRYQISALTKTGYGPTEIAKELEVHKSTISRKFDTVASLPMISHETALSWHF